MSYVKSHSHVFPKPKGVRAKTKSHKRGQPDGANQETSRRKKYESVTSFIIATLPFNSNYDFKMGLFPFSNFESNELSKRFFLPFEINKLILQVKPRALQETACVMINQVRAIALIK